MATPGLMQAMVENSGGGDTTATASPSPVAPVQPGDLAQPVNTLPATAPSIAPQPTDQRLEDLRKQSYGSKVYHGIMNALGGSQDVTFDRDETGKMVAHMTPSTPGMQWKRIISGALTGFEGGEEAGTQGPGGAMRGLAGGIKAGVQGRQAQETRERGQADEDYKAKLDTASQNLNRSLLANKVAQSALELDEAGRKADQGDLDLQNAYEQMIATGGPGTHDLGVMKTFGDAQKVANEYKDLHGLHANGRTFIMNNIVNGRKDGFKVAVVTPDWLHDKTTKDHTFAVPEYEQVDGKWQWVDKPHTVEAGETNEVLSQWMMASAIASNQRAAVQAGVQKTEADTAKTTAETKTIPGMAAATEAEKYAAAERDRAQGKMLNEATDSTTIQSNAQQLVEGSMDPSNLSKRGKTYDPTLAAANAYSMAKYGKPFNVAKAIGDYKFATNVGTYNTLNYLNSLTGRDNQSGNLTSVVNLSDKLKRSDFPALNAVEQWAKLSAGNPEIAGYRAGLLEVSDQIAKILQGGGTGNATSDNKLKDAQSLLDKNFNAKQIRSVALELRELLANRKQEIIGDNRYLMQWHGAPAAAAPGPAAGAAPAALGVGKTISLADALALPQFQGKSATDVRAAAQQLGYTVVQ